MSIYERLDNEEWKAWVCSDCDPELEEEADVEPRYEKPYVLLLPKGETPPDYCDRCESYLSMCDGPSGLRISNTPDQRYAAKLAEAESRVER